MLDLQRLRLFSRQTVSAALVLLLSAGMLTAGVGCEDPLAALEQVKTVVAESAKSAASAGGNFADDEAAKARAGGISLGPDHAKRLYYQFVDSRGRVRFVERKSDVPPQWRDRVGFVEMDTPPPLSPAMAERARDKRYALVAAKMGPKATKAPRTNIILYSAVWCGWCQKAKQHLNAKGVRYEVRDIDMSNNLDELVAKTGQKGVPVLDVGGKVVTGFSSTRYDELIASARG